MSKNYFTDSQINEIYYSEAGDSIEKGAFEFYKGLFNKSVEAAIGQKLAFRVEHFDGGYELNFNETWQKVKEQLPLYSVKELES